MDSILLFDALIAAGLLILYGTILVNWWRRPREQFRGLKFGSESPNPRSAKAMWGIVLLLPIAFSGVLAATWLPIVIASDTAAVDSRRGAEIMVEEAWGGGDGHEAEGIIILYQFIVQDGTVTRSTAIRIPWFLLAVCAAYAVFVLKPPRKPTGVGSEEPAPPNA